jgi:heme A synthase
VLSEVGDAWLTHGDAWLWYEESPFYELGGWEAFEDEARRLLLGTLTAYPLAHLRAAIDATLLQLVMVETGDWLSSPTDDTRHVIEAAAPGSAAAYRAARQQQRDDDFSIENLVHVPVALAATALLTLVIWLALRRVVRPPVGLFAAVVLLALVGNAFICGALANPHHRYQSRLTPLALLVVAVAVLTSRQGRGVGMLSFNGTAKDEQRRPRRT